MYSPFLDVALFTIYEVAFSTAFHVKVTFESEPSAFTFSTVSTGFASISES